MWRNGFFQHGGQDPEASAKLLSVMWMNREQNLSRGRRERKGRDRDEAVVKQEFDKGETLWERLPSGLTAEQRVHLETLGYVIVPDVLSQEEVEALRAATYELEENYKALHSVPEPCFIESDAYSYFRANNVIHVHPAFFGYATNPNVVSMAAVAIGLRPRLVESEVTIRRQPRGGQDFYDFHRAVWFDGTTINGWYHYPMVKALTYLTDVGPEDGGTAIVPASHKLRADASLDFVANTVLESKSLISTVSASAGSTLLFFESLMHSNGVIRSGRERVAIVTAYTPMMFQPVSGHEPQAELLSTLTDDYYDLVDGGRTYLP